MKKEDFSTIAMGISFICSLLLALLLVPMYPKEYRAFGEETTSLWPIVFFVVVMLSFTAVILYIARKKKEKVIQYLILGAMSVTMGYVIYPLLLHIYPYWWILPGIGFMDNILDLSMTLSACITIALTAALYKKPEWYVVDAAGILVAAGVAAILGMSLSILPVIVLLIVLAAYDAISVYKTKHMVSLADSVTELHLPILLVIPKEPSKYSYMEQEGIKKQLDEGKEREAMFMGLGDIVIPGILVVSAYVFLSQSTRIAGVPGNFIVSLCTLAGSFIGFSALMHFVRKGNPQAGLPLLNSSAIIAYLISYYLVYRDLTFGISLKLW